MPHDQRSSPLPQRIQQQTCQCAKVEVCSFVRSCRGNWFAAVAALQLRMLELWRTSGEVIHSPLFWAAVSCYDGSERRVVPYEAGAA